MIRVAIYARYSTDKQSDASISDQCRNCERYVQREGWTIVKRYSDEGISGAVTARPGYQQMLRDADSKVFDVLLFDDLSRLSRDDVEMKMVIKRFGFRGLRVIGVSDGYDSAQKGHKVHAGMRGLMNEIYIDDVREKTHRGLTGKAMNGFSCGGICYGYKSVAIEDPSKKDEFGRPLIIAAKREINEEQAVWVRKIFEWFADGYSARWISAELNRLKIPSAMGGTWCSNAFHGVQAKRTGMFNNEIYIGKIIWNKRQFIKDPDTGKRRAIMRPESDWVITDAPELRIIPQEIWDKVKGRQWEQHKNYKAKVEIDNNPNSRWAPPYKYLFSGMLKCSDCGHSYVKTGSSDRYGCSGHVNRGDAVCRNNITVSRPLLETRLLDAINECLSGEDLIEYFIQEASQILNAEKGGLAPGLELSKNQLKAVDTKIDNIMNAIKAGIFTPTIREELEKAEAERNMLRTEIEVCGRQMQNIGIILPSARDKFKEMLQDLQSALIHEIPKSRTIIQKIIGKTITLKPTEDRKLVAELSANILDMLGISNNKRIVLVAGARFELTTFRL